MGDSVSQPVPASVTGEDHTSAFVPGCPVCGGATKPTTEVRPASMFACLECSTTVFVPPGAWTTARRKRMMKWREKNT